MFVKLYRYRVRPDKVEDYLDIQARACSVYRKYTEFQAVHLRDHSDPSLWIELNFYPDRQSYDKAISAVNSDPMIHQLFAEFQATLVDGTDIEEEEYIQVLVDGEREVSR
jgi:uncharacterized protein YbaA (DUF1428 family)